METPYPSEKIPTSAPQNPLQAASARVQMAIQQEELLKQPKYRCLLGITNVKAAATALSWLGLIGSCNPIGWFVYWRAIQALDGGDKGGSLKPAIVLTVLGLVLMGIITLVYPLVTFFLVQPQGQTEAISMALGTFVSCALGFLFQLWILFVYRRARDFLEKTKKIGGNNQGAAYHA